MLRSGAFRLLRATLVQKNGASSALLAGLSHRALSGSGKERGEQEEDPNNLGVLYEKYPEACQHFKSFGADLPSQRRCPACAEKFDTVEELLDHMEHTPSPYEDIATHADPRYGLDWDACGINPETGEWMWGND